MMEKIDIENKIDVFSFISEIRERRQTLVQNLFQYIFIHDALHEYCLYGFTDIKSNKIKDTIKCNLKQNVSQSNVDHFNYIKRLFKKRKQVKIMKSPIEFEFDKLCNRYKTYKLNDIDAKYYYSSSNNIPATASIYYLLNDYKQKFNDAFSADNKTKNRNVNSVCYDFNRIKLTPTAAPLALGRKGSKTYSNRNSLSYNYINATRIKCLRNLDKEFIITQDPMTNTIVDFFTMIAENDSNIIVSLNNEIEPVSF